MAKLQFSLNRQMINSRFITKSSYETKRALPMIQARLVTIDNLM